LQIGAFVRFLSVIFAVLLAGVSVSTPQRDLYITVDKGVKDEVLDWGGTGRTVILLAGQGVTARGFDEIIPNLVARYHVYSVTRRGFGNSSKPAVTTQNYNADRLGQDVLAIMTALKVDKPVLIGHSLAGEELSYIGTHYPQKVAALVYLDAGYSYAYYSGLAMPQPPQHDPLGDAIKKGMAHYTGPINVPILAIFANPHIWPPGMPVRNFDDYTTKQIAAFKRGLPNAKVIVIPHADHFVYNSNKDEVLRDINSFIATLPST
jgi:pimeloyl-ACP methyl ester carboxylesterase